MAQQNAKRKQVQAIPDLEGPPFVLPKLTTGLGTRFFSSMNDFKDKIHQVDTSTGVTETKGSVQTRAIQVATEMLSRGIKRGQIVILCSKPNLDQMVALLACLYIGTIIAPVSTELPYDELQKIISTLAPKVAFCSLRAAQLVSRALKCNNQACEIYVFKGDAKDFHNFSKCFDHKVNKEFRTAQVVEPEKEVAFIICTQGSERDPKLVSLSHQAIYVRYMPMTTPFVKKGEKILSFLSLSWLLQVVACCVCFQTQGMMIFSGPVTERGICKFIHDLRIEHLYAQTDTLVSVVNNAPLLDFDFSCLKAIVLDGIPLSATNYSRLRRYFPGVQIIHTYKDTEAGTIAEITEEQEENHMPNFIGKLNPGVTIRVVDIYTRRIIGPDKWGELLVKSPGMMACYFRNQQLTFRAFAKGFFKTGDIVQYDSDGNLYLKGRLGAMVSKDGHSFFSSEVEEALLEHHLIKEVAVFQSATEIVACIIKKGTHELTSNAVLEFAVDVLPEYKRPTKVKFYEIFPKTLHGIVKKYLMRDSALRLVRENSFYHSEVVDE